MGMILFRRSPGLLLRVAIPDGCRWGVDMFDCCKKFRRTFKCMSIVYWIILILICQSALAQNDAFVEALKQKVENVNAQVDATFESIADAFKSEQVKSTLAKKKTQENPVEAEISRALFTTGIRDEEPVNELYELKRTRKLLFFFTEILGMTNRQLEHRWYYEDQQVKVETIHPLSPQWRVVSRVQLEDRFGMWAVEVVDENDKVLLRKEILYESEEIT